jgi:hypothetical protein
MQQLAQELGEGPLLRFAERCQQRSLVIEM